MKPDYEKLKSFASTPRQQEILDTLIDSESQAEAARKLGINTRTLEKHLKRIKEKAALSGYSPEHGLTESVPNPFIVEKMSLNYGPDGELKQKWLKTKACDYNTEEIIKNFVEDMIGDVVGRFPPQKLPTVSNSNLLSVYPMGDPHFGLHAWAEETGDQDFDIKEAERVTTEAISRLVASSPAADTGILLSLGDLFHADNHLSKTERSGNVLDVDTRWAKVMRVVLRCMIFCVSEMLKKHAKVIVRLVRGNHDPHSSYAISLALDAYFNKEERITVDLSPNNFWYYEFGKVLIGSTHGHTCKINELPGIMACDEPMRWGRTEHRYWYIGHVHHRNVPNIKEYPGIVCETFRTLAARDAWHSESGYRSGKDMYCIVHHKKYGEIERHRCDIAMIT